MSEKDAFDAKQEARRDLTSDPGRPMRHEDAIRIYLAGFAYTAGKHEAGATRAARERETDQAAQ